MTAWGVLFIVALIAVAVAGWIMGNKHAQPIVKQHGAEFDKDKKEAQKEHDQEIASFSEKDRQRLLDELNRKMR